MNHLLLPRQGCHVLLATYATLGRCLAAVKSCGALSRACDSSEPHVAAKMSRCRCFARIACGQCFCESIGTPVLGGALRDPMHAEMRRGVAPMHAEMRRMSPIASAARASVWPSLFKRTSDAEAATRLALISIQQRTALDGVASQTSVARSCGNTAWRRSRRRVWIIGEVVDNSAFLGICASRRLLSKYSWCLRKKLRDDLSDNAPTGKRPTN